MRLFRQQKLRQERLRWGMVFFICAFTVMLFTSNESKRSLLYRMSHPFSVLAAEQENPILHLVSKIVAPTIPERMREGIPL